METKTLGKFALGFVVGFIAIYIACLIIPPVLDSTPRSFFTTGMINTYALGDSLKKNGKNLGTAIQTLEYVVITGPQFPDLVFAFVLMAWDFELAVLGGLLLGASWSGVFKRMAAEGGTSGQSNQPSPNSQMPLPIAGESASQPTNHTINAPMNQQNQITYGPGKCGITGKTIEKESTVYGVPVEKKWQTKYASARQTAFVIDVIVASIAAVVIGGIFPSEDVALIFGWIASTVAIALRDSFNGKSIGKMICKLTVVDKDGDRITWETGAKRNWMISIPYVGGVLAIIGAIQLFKGPRIGDGWAKTYVVWDKYPSAPAFNDFKNQSQANQVAQINQATEVGQ